MSDAELEPSRDAELWNKLKPELELTFELLGPIGALVRYARDRLLRTLEAADDELAGQLHVALEAAKTSEALADLFYDAFDAARRSRLHQKHRAFGRAIARGWIAADDDAQVDAERLTVGILNDLEMPHLRALDRIASNPDERVEVMIEEMYGAAAGAMVVAVLTKHSLVSPQTPFDGGSIHQGLTTLGHYVWAYLEGVADVATD